MPANVYWAAQPLSADFVDAATQRFRRWASTLVASGRARRALSGWRTYYGSGPDGTGDTSALSQSGEQGELVDFTTPEYATLVDQALALTTASKPAFKSIANTDDFKALAQCQLSDGLIGAYERDSGLDDREDEACLAAILTSEAWVVESWDKAKGRPLAPAPVKAAPTEGAEEGAEPSLEMTGDTVFEGDVRFDVALLWDVRYEAQAKDKEALTWFAFRSRINKWDEAARIEARGRPGDVELAAKLRGMTPTYAEEFGALEGLGFGRGRMRDSKDEMSEDLLDAWEVRHLKTPACRNGRLVRFIDSTTILFDSYEQREDGTVDDHGYPYAELHAYVMEPAKVVGTSAGHTSTFDMLSCQSNLDTVGTAMATAAAAGGVTNTWVGPEANLEVTEVSGGLNFIKSATKPEQLQGPQIDPQAPAFGDFVRMLMTKRLGLNDVAMGEPTKGMPAQLAALLQAQAVQFNSRLARAYQKLRAKTRTGLLKLLKRYARTSRVVELAGKSNVWALKEFTADDLQGVTQVTVEAVNPVLGTTAGKMSLLDILLQHGAIRPQPENLVTFMTTGQLPVVFDFEKSNELRLTLEKEMLRNGIGLPPVDQAASDAAGTVQYLEDGKQHIRPLLTDTPWLDIKEYAAVLATPGARENPEVVQAVTNLIHAKLDIWAQQPPQLSIILGGQPFDSLAPPPLPPPGEEGPPPAPGAGPDIKQPAPPPNPLTGERAPPPMPGGAP